jgi:glycosyltransferase involved in cell wall biosynthesis
VLTKRRLDPQQRGSHSQLLFWDVPLTGEHRPLDAIIVPTARPHPYLVETLELAKELKVPVLLLCSKWASAGESIAKARDLGVQAIATDVPERMAGMPTFATSEMLAGLRFERRTDVSLKRNIGLAVARMVGWQRLMFLDDDIRVDEPDHIRKAAALLGRFGAVGLANNGFPDNSVVCHANRAAGYEQGSFIGGGAMAVLATRGNAFFPNIYNEDWFFLLDEQSICNVVATGVMTQKEFDPFADSMRARAEEFGDCLAEGIFAVLDQQGSVSDADETFWHGFLGSRHEMINRCLAVAMAPGNRGKPDFERMAASLKAARGRLEHITPELCVGYIRAWQRDRKVWRSYLKRLPRAATPSEALSQLGLGSRE